ncbi:MAG: coproporphyrinogen III oxidase, partial [Prevotella sp.]|nr:coproporphyrinogen III oxidase [Prevotella sp.]
MAGLYIHIPFCASRCIYCGFYSTTKTNLQDRYVDAMCKEMELRCNELVSTNRNISTIYIG